MLQNRILLVLDNMQSGRHLMALLQDVGYVVDWHALSEKALKSVSTRPDLIIFDSLLLDNEELRIFESLKRRSGWRDIPTLVIATILDGSSKARVRLLAADEIVAKPIDSAELLVKVKSILRMRSLEFDASLTAKNEISASKFPQQLATDDPLANLSYIAARQASGHSLETIFVQLLRYVLRIVPCDEGVICVQLPSGRFGVIAHVGGGKCDLASSFGVGESYTGWIAQHKEPLLVNDIDAESRVQMMGREEGITRALNSFVGLPLMVSGRIIGTLELASYRRNSFSEATLDILRPIAQVASLAMENVGVRRDFAEQVYTLWLEFDRYRRQLMPVYESQAMEWLMKAAAKVRDSKCAVLITGETGTGKELLARYIHYEGSRRHFPFVDLNCAAVPESLQESELFGIENGVATGVEKRIGKFEAASSGALFLDEVAYMPVPMQAKILRVLQERTFERVGGNTKLPFQGRIIAATSRDINQSIRDGCFKEELYYRLAVVHLHIPPLRDRKEDIPPLVRHFVRLFCQDQNRLTLSVSPAVMDSLVCHDWPGNVRELRNAVERAVLFSQGMELTFEPLSSGIGNIGHDKVLQLFTLALEQGLSAPELLSRYARFTYERIGRNKLRACSLLKINYRTLRKKLHETELNAGRNVSTAVGHSTDRKHFTAAS